MKRSRQYFASSAVLFVVGIAAVVVDSTLYWTAVVCLVGAISLAYIATTEEKKEILAEPHQKQSSESPPPPPPGAG